MAVEAPEAGHNAAVVRKLREMNAAVRLSPFYSVHAPWRLPATFLRVFPALLKPFWKYPLWTYLEIRFHGDPKSSHIVKED